MRRSNSEASVIPSDTAVLSTTLRTLVPDGVIVVELRGEGDPGQLLPVEATYLKRAVQKRVREFAAGRQCARRALAELGIVDFAIAMADRRPVWPDSIVGSITHTDGFSAAAVAKSVTLASIGIDTESAAAVKPHLWESICRPAEIAWLNTLPGSERSAAATLLFSAKEAFYKCQSPLTAQFLEFHAAEVQISNPGERHGSFSVSAPSEIALSRLAPPPWTGRFLFHEQFVTTVVWLPATEVSRDQ